MPEIYTLGPLHLVVCAAVPSLICLLLISWLLVAMTVSASSHTIQLDAKRTEFILVPYYIVCWVNSCISTCHPSEWHEPWPTDYQYDGSTWKRKGVTEDELTEGSPVAATDAGHLPSVDHTGTSVKDARNKKMIIPKAPSSWIA